jgi:hypothetical protein
MQLHVVDSRCDRDPNRTAPAAHIEDNGAGPRGGNSLIDEELGAPPGYENAGLHRDPRATKLCPAEDLLERKARHSAINHRLEIGWI